MTEMTHHVTVRCIVGVVRHLRSVPWAQSHAPIQLIGHANELYIYLTVTFAYDVP